MEIVFAFCVVIRLLTSWQKFYTVFGTHSIIYTFNPWFRFDNLWDINLLYLCNMGAYSNGSDENKQRDKHAHTCTHPKTRAEITTKGGHIDI